MAATVAARRLTETHRLAQARLGSQAVSAMLATWRLLDPDDLDGTFDRWLVANMPIIAGQRRASARLAANYLSSFKTLELSRPSDVPVVLADDLTADAVQTSLLVTGPVRVKAAMTRGVPVDQAMSTAQTASARAAMRHVLDGGRVTTINTVAADRQAIGWARATSGQPCHFCAMVASRGPVYRSDSSASFEPHDGCSCSAEPIYREDAAWPSGAARYRELWDEATVADGDTTANFRRLIDDQAA